MKDHAIRWWGDPADFRLRRVSQRGQYPLLVERRRGDRWDYIVRVSSEREAERIVERARQLIAEGKL